MCVCICLSIDVLVWNGYEFMMLAQHLKLFWSDEIEILFYIQLQKHFMSKRSFKVLGEWVCI